MSVLWMLVNVFVNFVQIVSVPYALGSPSAVHSANPLKPQHGVSNNHKNFKQKV